MLSATIDISKWNWRINLHCAATCYHANIILRELAIIGCPAQLIMESARLMNTCSLNIGLTYSNPFMRESVVVIALTSSAAEFQNSLQHELYHCVAHIVKTDNLRDLEKPAYLMGEINREMFPYTRYFLCR